MSADEGSTDAPRADSGGVPFAGRALAPSPFAGDDGTPVPALAAALAGPLVDVAAVHAALMDARVFVPVLAVAGDHGDDSADGSGAGSAGSDMALPVLKAPDGRETMPMFSSVASLTAWDASARPVPSLARRVALVAVQEGRQLIVLDPAGPATVVLPRPAMWALGRGSAWIPAPRDPAVAAAVEAAVTVVDGVLAAGTTAGQRAELRVVLTVPSGLDRPRLKTLTDAVAAALAADAVVAERVDSLELELVAAGA